jgi:uncharacterized membrane protein
MVTAAEKGEAPDPMPGLRAKQRSLHNNYFTLPVLFIMISNHYPGTFGHDYSWLVLAGLALVGILVRHYFNMKNQGRAKQGFFLLPLSFVLFFVIAYFAAPKSIDLSEGPAVPYAVVQTIIDERCVSCHAQKPSNKDFEVAPKAVKLETTDQIRREIKRIRQQVVDSTAMPLGNLTEMTDEERLLVGRWIAQGGSTD